MKRAYEKYQKDQRTLEATPSQTLPTSARITIEMVILGREVMGELVKWTEWYDDAHKNCVAEKRSKAG